jgi:predicted phage terminase large subunit-like protein
LVKEISPSLRDQEVFGLFVDEKEIGIINNDWWQYFDESTIYQQRVLRKTQSWDTAYKKNEENDYSVCTTWIEGLSGFYLIDMWKGRLEFPELKKKANELYELHKPHEILIEDKASGQSLIQELQRETKIPIKPIKIESDKIARVHAITPLIEAGKVYLPLNKYWIKDFTNECEDFPNGEFDDVVDSMSQYLNYAKKGKPGNVGSIVHVPRKNINIKRIRRIKRLRKYGGR